jgi:hypothetical protein
MNETTHYPGCYDSGPRHYECALLEVERLRREWVGLTHEERYLDDGRTDEEIEYAKGIEALLREKNGG